MAKVMLSFLLCVVVTTISARFAAATPLPAASNCSTIIGGMSDCLQYVGFGANVSKPDENGTCCTALKDALRSNLAVCLCTIIDESVNVTRLSSLTLDCHAPNGFDSCPLPPSGQVPPPVEPKSSPSPSPSSTSIPPPSSRGGPVYPPTPSTSTPPPPFHNEPVPAPPPTNVTPPPSNGKPVAAPPPQSVTVPLSSPTSSEPPSMASSPPPAPGSAFKLASSAVATFLVAAIAAVVA